MKVPFVALALSLSATIVPAQTIETDFDWAKAKKALAKALSSGDRAKYATGYMVDRPGAVTMFIFIQDVGSVRVPAYKLQTDQGPKWMIISERDPDIAPTPIE